VINYILGTMAWDCNVLGVSSLPPNIEKTPLKQNKRGCRGHPIAETAAMDMESRTAMNIKQICRGKEPLYFR
jgi:hypothetical protein